VTEGEVKLPTTQGNNSTKRELMKSISDMTQAVAREIEYREIRRKIDFIAF
jgi:hypothetical protein